MCLLTVLRMMQLNSTTMRPPVVPSAEFTADFEYTLAFGSINSTNRTAYQTDTAKFWYDETMGKNSPSLAQKCFVCAANELHACPKRSLSPGSQLPAVGHAFV